MRTYLEDDDDDEELPEEEPPSWILPAPDM